jgi:hypothetical protein
VGIETPMQFDRLGDQRKALSTVPTADRVDTPWTSTKYQVPVLSIYCWDVDDDVSMIEGRNTNILYVNYISICSQVDRV